MLAKKETLKRKDADGNEYITYPKTLTDCVVDNNGKRLSDTMDRVVFTKTRGGEDEPFEALPNDADTLGGCTLEEINNKISDAYSAESTYAVGNYCIYENELYKCTVAIETPEAWNAEHWIEVSVIEELANKLGCTSAVLSENQLWFNNLLGSIACWSGSMNLLYKPDPTKPTSYMRLALSDTGGNALLLSKYVEGVESYYRMYGEHNVTKGTSALTAGTSTLATGCIYLQYE